MKLVGFVQCSWTRGWRVRVVIEDNFAETADIVPGGIQVEVMPGPVDAGDTSPAIPAVAAETIANLAYDVTTERLGGGLEVELIQVSPLAQHGEGAELALQLPLAGDIGSPGVLTAGVQEQRRDEVYAAGCGVELDLFTREQGPTGEPVDNLLARRGVTTPRRSISQRSTDRVSEPNCGGIHLGVQTTPPVQARESSGWRVGLLVKLVAVSGSDTPIRTA